MASLLLSEKLSVAFAPVITTGTAQFNPAFFAPGPKDQFGIPTFPVATNSRSFWGGGFELGTMYEVNESWNLGFSYKSPVWQEKWMFNSYNPDYSARRIGVQADMPAIYSLGAAYKGIDRLVVDVDLRYFDYASAPLWGDQPVNGGLGWKSIMAVAAGGQYQLSDRLTLRGGYLFNQNPIHEINTVFNIQAPGFIQHTLSLGASLRINDNILATVGWVHGFRNAIQGPIGQIPGTSARMDAQTDSILAGLTIQYGGRRSASKAAAEAAPTEEVAEN
jgi:long-chain fatty acid transport protein